jgi:general L-amino acid transport system substrate-binding protein
VKAKGFVQCGVNTGLLGFASTNDKGECGRIDIDYSKAVAAAILQRRHQGQVLRRSRHRAFHRAAIGRSGRAYPQFDWTMSREPRSA